METSGVHDNSLSRKIQMCSCVICSCVKCTRVSGNFSLMLSILLITISNSTDTCSQNIYLFAYVGHACTLHIHPMFERVQYSSNQHFIYTLFKEGDIVSCETSLPCGPPQWRKFTNHPDRPCKSWKKSKSVNKSVLAIFCVPNISIYWIDTYFPVLTLFACVMGRVIYYQLGWGGRGGRLYSGGGSEIFLVMY